MTINSKAALLTFAALAMAGCATVPADPVKNADASGTADRIAAAPGVAHPEIWPRYTYPVPRKPAQEAAIARLLAAMSLEEKIGQLVQADLCCVTPDDVRNYSLGSILVGGNSGPDGDDLAAPAKWLAAADAFYDASVDKTGGRTGIPIIWGIDAVHGNSNIIGATLFPHNIGLGAMRDPDLVEQIGAVTAREIRVTGQEWTFAPTVTVPQDFRWGRAYEGYSSDPELVASYVGAMVRGLQGDPKEENLLARDKVIASTKHFLADGGTEHGVDQGDAKIDEQTLRDIHGVPYGPAIENGVATVMASFSSWQGRKMTGNRSLLTGVLKEQMGFGGFVVSDWNAHGQVEGCTNDACSQALEAGIDMYMAPDTWKPIYEDLLARTKAGTLPMARVNEAVSDILRVKMRLGVFQSGKPSSRPLSGRYDLLGAPEHRAVARQAVRESLVLLKNEGVLPLAPGRRLLVAGDGADDIARQSGGWTISWQGTGLKNSQFPGATSLFNGLRSAVESAGGSAELAPDGRFTHKPDAAIVVFGEKPYAEFQGDRATLALDNDLTGPYETMRRLKAQDIPVVAVMLTGRPLYVNPALNLADAFVVAWLPGSEGAGLADVLIGKAGGGARFDFRGKLPAAWPRTVQMADGALFPFGYGLSYQSPHMAWRPLAEVDTSAASDARLWFANGVPASGWSLLVSGGASGETRITAVPAEAAGGQIKVTAENFMVQEGARRFAIADGTTSVSLRGADTLNVAKETNGDVLMLVTTRVFAAPSSARIGAVGPTGQGYVGVNLPATGDFVRYGIPLKCLRDKGADVSALTQPFVIETTGRADYAIGEVRLGTDAEEVLPCD